MHRLGKRNRIRPVRGIVLPAQSWCPGCLDAPTPGTGPADEARVCARRRRGSIHRVPGGRSRRRVRGPVRPPHRRDQPHHLGPTGPGLATDDIAHGIGRAARRRRGARRQGRTLAHLRRPARRRPSATTRWSSSASRGTPTTTHRPAWSRWTCAPPATAPRSSYGTSGSPTAPRSTCASTGRRPWTAWLRAPPRKRPSRAAQAALGPLSPGTCSGVLASPTTYSQCHGSSRELGGMAHAGLSQPKAGALARIQSYSTERYFSTPLQKSTARPMPCSLVPGTARQAGLARGQALLRGDGSVGVGEAEVVAESRAVGDVEPGQGHRRIGPEVVTGREGQRAQLVRGHVAVRSTCSR